MRVITLLYHDVIGNGDFSASGFRGPGADSYKLTAADFAAHLDAVARTSRPVGGMADRAHALAPAPDAVLLTFDDGGASMRTEVALRLEKREWRGYLFITTDYIGTRGFLTRAEIRELHERGHVIGSHSASHPPRMSACTREQLRDEWQRSVDLLGDIVGAPVTTASVPGGYFSRVVAETAAECGIRTLFNSEPTTRVARIDGCMVLGRFSLRRGDPASVAAGLVGRAPIARGRQWCAWNAKKVAKTIGGEAYLKARALVMHGR